MLKVEDENQRHRLDHNWHVGINRTQDERRAAGKEWSSGAFLYDAKEAAQEAERLPKLFKAERTGTLPKLHRQCSLSPTEPVPDNHLTCVLGVECRKCEFLLALERNTPEVTPEVMDQIKAITCITHILREDAAGGGLDTSEGMILTVDDRMFWDRVIESMAADQPDQEALSQNPS